MSSFSTIDCAVTAVCSRNSGDEDEMGGPHVPRTRCSTKNNPQEAFDRLDASLANLVSINSPKLLTK